MYMLYQSGAMNTHGVAAEVIVSFGAAALTAGVSVREENLFN